MAFGRFNPFIRVNSGDANAHNFNSGAGPSVPITGVSGICSGAFAILTNASPDLSTVSGDGSHVIFINTPTSFKKFNKIVAVDDVEKTLRCELPWGNTGATITGFGGTGVIWRIGGVRDYISSGVGFNLISNNASTGDLKAGWSVCMWPEHRETATGNIVVRAVLGNMASGLVQIVGRNSGTMRPVFNMGNFGWQTNNNCEHIVLDRLHLINPSATKTAAAISVSQGRVIILKNLVIGSSGQVFRTGIEISTSNSTGNGVQIENCTIDGSGFTNAIGVRLGLSSEDAIVKNCSITRCSGAGIAVENGTIVGKIQLMNNLIHACGTGIMYDGGSTTNPNILAYSCKIYNNTIDSCSGHAIAIVSNVSAQKGRISNLDIVNNIMSNNKGHGIYVSGLGCDSDALKAGNVLIDANVFWNNTSGNMNVYADDIDKTSYSHQVYFTSSGFAPPNFFAGLAYPSGNLGNTTNYDAPGAIQPPAGLNEFVSFGG